VLFRNLEERSRAIEFLLSLRLKPRPVGQLQSSAELAMSSERASRPAVRLRSCLAFSNQLPAMRHLRCAEQAPSARRHPIARPEASHFVSVSCGELRRIMTEPHSFKRRGHVRRGPSGMVGWLSQLDCGRRDAPILLGKGSRWASERIARHRAVSTGGSRTIMPTALRRGHPGDHRCRVTSSRDRSRSSAGCPISMGHDGRTGRAAAGVRGYGSGEQ